MKNTKHNILNEDTYQWMYGLAPSRGTLPTGRIRFGGADNGSSGAMAFTYDEKTWDVRLVSIFRQRRHWLLSVSENLAYVREIANQSDGTENLVIAYERTRKNRMFGTNNNHVGGRHEEFWRVLLATQDICHCSVDPRTWQSVCFKGIKLPDTKDRAREYIRRRCPGTEWLDEYNKAPREAIVDAMCIALWCKDRYLADHSSAASESPAQLEA